MQAGSWTWEIVFLEEHQSGEGMERPCLLLGQAYQSIEIFSTCVCLFVPLCIVNKIGPFVCIRAAI